MSKAQGNANNDGLKELESLLEKDLRSSQPVMRGMGITRDQVRRALVRLGVSLLLLLLLFWFEVFENATTVLIGIFLVAVMEGVLLFIGRSGNESRGRGE